MIEKNIIEDFANRYGDCINNYTIIVKDINESKRAAKIEIVDNRKSAICPYCNKKTNLFHHYRCRYFFDGSIIDNLDYIYDIISFKYRVYECSNKKCKKYFTPSNIFVEGKEHYTDSFKEMIRFLYNEKNNIKGIIHDFEYYRSVFLNRNKIANIIKK